MARKVTKKAAPKEKFDLYQVVTDKIIAILKAGTVPWRKPWNAITDFPRNIDGRRYRGLNVWLLLAESRSTPFWMTHKQVEEKGGTVIKGEHGTLVVFFTMLETKQLDDKGKPRKVPLLRYFRVFNLDQTEGVKLPKGFVMAPEPVETDPIAAAEAIVKGMPNPPSIRHDGGDKAYWKPGADGIHLPKISAFENRSSYYATLFHELTHSTATKERCDRATSIADYAFNTHSRSREELIAELGSAFLAGEAGTGQATIDNSAAYVASWIKVLQEDNHAVVVASSAAQRAVDFILDRKLEVEQEVAA